MCVFTCVYGMVVSRGVREPVVTAVSPVWSLEVNLGVSSLCPLPPPLGWRDRGPTSVSCEAASPAAGPPLRCGR